MAPRKSKLDPYADMVGILPDKLIAEMAGVSVENVRARRKRHSIPARWRGEGELLPNEAAILEEAGLEPSPAPKKATKKRKAAKPKVKKIPAKSRKPRAKKPKVKPVVEAAPVVEDAQVVEPEVEAEPVIVVELAPEAVAGIEPVVEAEPEAVHEPVVVEEAEPTPDPAPTPAPKTSPRPTKTRKPRKSKLDPYMDKVGVLSDREVAELAGVSFQNVTAYRNRRGIPALWRSGGAVPKAAAAKAPKSKTTAKRRARRGKLTPFMDQIGILSDSQIAKMAGTSPTNVRAFRLRHGIPAQWRGEGEPLPTEPAAAPALAPTPAPVPVPVTAPRGRKPRRGKLTPHLEEIGILSDSVIADKAGTTAQNVRAYRLRHQIPARWRGEGEPLPNEEAILALRAGLPAVEEPAPVVEPVPAPVVEAVAALVVEAAPEAEPVPPVDDDLPPEADDMEAAVPALVIKGYKVKVVAEDEKTTFVVTGSDIVEAATNAVAAMAQRSPDAEVVELKFLAVMLRA